MKSICFFCSYYSGQSIPAYVKFYLRELKVYFSEVIFVTTMKEFPSDDITFLNDMGIIFKPVINEGYDFGMYYKMIKEYDLTNYDRVGLINDSCILFNKLNFVFKWIDEEKADYCSLTDTNEISYHLQSYFLIINKKAIPFVIDYFNKNGIVKDILELIRVYEVGLSTYLSNAGLSIKVCYPVKKNRRGNPTYLDTKNLIKKGFPMIKKKVFLLDYHQRDWVGLVIQGFNPYPMLYIKLIKKMTGTSFPADIFSEFVVNKKLSDRFNFNAKYVIFTVYGFFWRIYSRAKRLIKV